MILIAIVFEAYPQSAVLGASEVALLFEKGAADVNVSLVPNNNDIP